VGSISLEGRNQDGETDANSSAATGESEAKSGAAKTDYFVLELASEFRESLVLSPEARIRAYRSSNWWCTTSTSRTSWREPRIAADC